MAGIFRQTSQSNSTTNESTPSHKRFSFGAFCTSPGTLQDVTMDNSYAVAGYRSLSGSLQPNNFHGTASPSTQGRSVREFEEQLSALRKENFNLKLKLYFMEETLPGYQQAAMSGNDGGPEALAKQIIDSKVEIEMLRKDCKEKQDLLKDAAQAITHLEDLQKQTEEKYQTVVDELKQKINFMEMERELERSQSNVDVNSELMNCQNAVGGNELGDNINAMQKIGELESIIRDHEEQIEDFNTQITKLDEILVERDATISECNTKIKSLEFQNAELMESLERKNKDLNDAENEHLRKELQDLKAQMADKLCILDETEEKLKHRTEVYEKALHTIQKLMLNIGQQQKEIGQLKSNQSCASASALQNAHNLANMTTASAMSGFEYTGNNGTTSLSGDTESQQHYAAAPSQKDAVVVDLRKQLLQAQNDAATADRWRRECADVCTVLTNRLEELAGFLNSLLKQKDVLGILAADRRRAIRKAVDRSLDLSKSLNMTLSFTGMSMGDQSLAQLSNLSEILGYAEDDGDAEQLTFNSHIDLSRPSNELQKRDDSGGKQHRRSGDGKKERRSLPLQQDIQSESEAWSEPDRKVSMARIGLDENSASLSKELPAKLLTVAGSSESECDVLNQSRNAKQRTHDRIVQLEHMIAQRDERILDIQSQLVDADNRLRQEHLQVLQLKQQIQDLEAKIAENHDAEAILKELAERTDMLDKCRTELDELKLKHEIAIALAAEQLKEKLKQLRTEMEAQQQSCVDKLNEQHRAVLEHDYVAMQQYDEIKTQLLELQRQYIEAQRTIDNLTDMEHELKQNLLDSELEARSLKKQLDESTLQASRAIMERTKACNDKLQLEQLVPHLKQQLAAHESERNHLHEQVVRLEEQLAEATTRLLLQCNKNSVNDATASGYTSEEVPATPNEKNAKVSENAASSSSRRSAVDSAQLRQHNTSSPDLGIESDAGRISSGEQSSAHQQRNSKLIELNISLQEHKTNIKAESSDEAVENIKPATASNKMEQTPQQPHDCAKVDLENAELRRKLLRTKKAFEDTYEKLRLANQKKAQIEKDIKNQILKTHNVLRNVRSNMENDL